MNRNYLVATGLLVALSSSVVPLQAQTWQSYSANNNGGAGGEYWDNVSADGASCNIGFVVSKTSGTCSNQFTPGWLPYSGPTMENNLRNGTGYAPLMFSAGTYRLRQGGLGLGGQIAGGHQPFGYFIRDGGGMALTTVLPETHSFDQTVTFTSAWGLFISEVGGGLSYSDLATNPYFALFGSRMTGLSTVGGLTTVLAENGDEFLAGYADVLNGDRDFNDEVLRISAVPEPSTYVLLATGFMGLLIVARRRRRV